MATPEIERCVCPRCGTPDRRAITIQTSQGPMRIIGCECAPKDGTPCIVDAAAWWTCTDEERAKLQAFAKRRD